METKPGDILLIYRQKEPVAFARVEDITADVKPGWWNLHLLFLNLPPQPGTWILKEEYIDGGDFTMGGEGLRLDLLPAPGGFQQAEPEPLTEEKPAQKGKVVSLARRRNKS